jgi:hypothetical protein
LFDIDDRRLIYLADRSVGFDTCSCAIEVSVASYRARIAGAAKFRASGAFAWAMLEGELLPLSLRASASSAAARSVSPLSA